MHYQREIKLTHFKHSKYILLCLIIDGYITLYIDRCCLLQINRIIITLNIN